MGGGYRRLTNTLLMTILTKTFLSFVGGHFMALTLLSAWHESLKKIGLIVRTVNSVRQREFQFSERTACLGPISS